MKRYWFFLSLLFLSGEVLQAQENPNVELPQFVITGKEAYDFPALDKQKPELVSAVSEQYFKPIYSPDDLEIKSFSEPIKKAGILLDSVLFVNGEAELSVGNNYLPSVQALYRLPMKSALFTATVSAKNQRPYIPDADRNTFSVDAGYNLISDDSSGFLPFSKFGVSTLLKNDAFKLFGSPQSDIRRNILLWGVTSKIENLISESFLYSLTLQNSYLNLKNDLMKEDVFEGKGYAKYYSKNINVSLSLTYTGLHSEFTPLLNENSGFIQARGMFGVSVGSIAKANFGLEYSVMDTNATVFPYVTASLNVAKGITLFGGYNPTSTLLTQKDFLSENRFFTPTTPFRKLFSTLSSRYFADIKYEYERVFDITSGLKISTYENFPYYMNVSPVNNVYQLDTLKARAFEFYARANFYLEKFGFFSGEFHFQNVHDTSENTIPNVVPLTAAFSYGMFITPEVSFSVSMMYYSPAFINFANNEKAKGSFDLGLKGEMTISDNLFAQLQIQNLLNKKNEIWKGYQEIPLSIAAGIRFIW